MLVVLKPFTGRGIELGAFLRGLMSAAPAIGAGSSSQLSPSTASSSLSATTNVPSGSAGTTPSASVPLDQTEVGRTPESSSGEHLITLALHFVAHPEPELVQVTRKRSRETANLREGPSSTVALASSSSSSRSSCPVARERTPGKGSGNALLSKQLITSYGDKKYSPKKEKKSAGSQDLPWGRLFVDPLPVPITSGSIEF
ncbi:hypothetical protein ACH5RR_012904 [Cinchona calisaya]|uniref:Uncharacterized protein n=1 Tax=Cinchona calisaya TaxID=153742 RepID=A0ABD3AAP2_9GENT